MKIILFDLKTDGHHIQHVNLLSRYCLSLGDEVVFITWAKKGVKRDLLLRDEKFHVEYVTDGNAIKDGENIFSYLVKQYMGLRYCFKYASKENADVVHLLYLERSEIPFFFNLLFFLRRKFQVFATLVVPYYLDAYLNISRLKVLFHAFNRRLTRYILKNDKLDKLFVLSEETRSKLIAEWGYEVSKKITFIPDPIEPFENDYSKMTSREILHLPGKKNVLLYFGNIRWDKGYDIFLKSLELDKSFLGVFAGKATQNIKLELEESIRLRNIKNIVTEIDFISDKRMALYYSSADVVVLPYRSCYKGTSGILQTAISAQRPVIASDVGDIGSIVKKWELGVVISPDSPKALREGIKEFLNKKEYYSTRVKEVSRRYIDKHHWRNMARNIRDQYEEKR